MKNIHFLSLLFLLVSSSLYSRNLYVAPGGLDTNPGSLTSPFRTIQRSLTIGQSGDTILVRAGTYHENLIWQNSGTVNALIVLKNYPNELVLVDGASQASLSLLEIRNHSHISVVGITFQTNYQQDARGIYVVGEGRRISISQCTVRNIGWGTDPNADPEAVPGQPKSAHGIVVNGRTSTGLSDIKITGCHVYSIITGNSEAVTIVGNVDGFEVSDNQVHDTRNIGIVAAGHYSWAVETGVNSSLNQARNGLIARNTVYNNRRFNNVNAPAGIYVDGGKSVRIVSNVSYQNGNGLSVGCENSNATAEAILIANNLVYDNAENGMVFGSATLTSRVEQSTITNNTFFKNGSAGSFRVEIILQRSSDCLIVNNIAIPQSNSHHGIGVFGYQLSNLTVSNNLLYRYTGYADDLYVPGTPAQFTPVNPITADPQFVNADFANLNLMLQIASPAINTGTNAVGVPFATDAAAQPRLVNGILDIGAYERQDGGCPTVFSVTNAHRLSGRFVASQRIEFNNGFYQLTEALTLKSPRVLLGARLQIGTLLKYEQAGCQ